FSERLPRVCHALVSPVDDSKHVWTYWARISKLLKGCRRHSFFWHGGRCFASSLSNRGGGMRVRVGVNTSIGYAGRGVQVPPYNDGISPLETPAPLSVKLDGREPSNKSRPRLRSNDAPVILSDISALDITTT
ncbi:MAG: hypothetical protein AB4372_18140, partial [Xenococcus sp. (in: cyanobacteria)]